MCRMTEYIQLTLLLCYKSNVKIAKSCSGIVQCLVFLGRLSGWLKFHLPRNNFTIKAVFGGLFSMLLAMKTQIIEQAQTPLSYLGGNNCNISTDKETSSKWVKYRQTSSRSIFCPSVWIFRFIIIVIWFITTETFISLLWIWDWVHDQCNIYGKMGTNHRMQTVCSPRNATVHVCWKQLDELAKCFVLAFCSLIVVWQKWKKQQISLLVLWQKQPSSCLFMFWTLRKCKESRYIITSLFRFLTEPLPSINLQLDVYFEKKRRE